ncbi:MAG: hypothetical protein FWG13_05260 [Leptospirales bacterium]|nr:hypothetical protein [Leptospirales bacterium]
MRTIDDIKAIVYNERDADERITSAFLRLAGKEKIPYSSKDELETILDGLKKRFASKDVIILKRFLGRAFQKCPASPGMICCNYTLLNTCFGCLYDCAYCFLNSYINFFGIVQFTHIEDTVSEILSYAASNESFVRRVGTGEFCDSLMMDELTGIGKILIESLSLSKNVMIELKTKSDQIEHLLSIPRKGNAVLAWSLNTEYAASRYEQGAAPLERRLAAAKKAAGAGYFLAFHFDPIIRYEGAAADYEALVHRLFSVIDPERVVWVSLGCFRYSPSFKEAPAELSRELTAAEMFPGLDAKMRYLRSFRLAVYKKMKETIYSYSRKPFVYLCMESSDMWYDVFGADYSNPDQLEEAMSRHIKKEFLQKL